MDEPKGEDMAEQTSRTSFTETVVSHDGDPSKLQPEPNVSVDETDCKENLLRMDLPGEMGEDAGTVDSSTEKTAFAPNATAAQIFHSASTLSLFDEDDGLPLILKAPAFDEEDGSLRSQLSTCSCDASLSPKTPIARATTTCSSLLAATKDLEQQITEAMNDVSSEIHNNAPKTTPTSILRKRLERSKQTPISENDMENIGSDAGGLISPIPIPSKFAGDDVNNGVYHDITVFSICESPSREDDGQSSSGDRVFNDETETMEEKQGQETDTIGLKEASVTSPDGHVEVKEMLPVIEKDEAAASSFVSDAVNDSATSTGSNHGVLRQQLSATSQTLHELVKGKAFLRKMNLKKSRDNLLAKERLHRQELEQEQRRHVEDEDEFDVEPPPPPPASHQTFKARPVPASVGVKGTGGLSGVPRVDKKPTTAPFSPLLGARRQLRKLSNAFNRSEKVITALESKHDDSVSKFRARPLPPSTGEAGHGGQSGVPKVSKRPVTVPFSPLLGVRRKSVQVEAIAAKNSSSVSHSSVNSVASQNASSASGPSLAGLGILNDENQVRIVDAIPTNEADTQDTAYVPYSTKRAKERALYDVRRKEAERQRIGQELRDRDEKVQQLEKELRKIGKAL